MKLFQMVAGQPPPCEPGVPPAYGKLLSVSVAGLLVNSATDRAASLGAAPMNHASDEFCPVPRVPVLAMMPPRRKLTLPSAVPSGLLLSKDNAQSTLAAACGFST